MSIDPASFDMGAPVVAISAQPIGGTPETMPLSSMVAAIIYLLLTERLVAQASRRLPEW